VALARAEKNLKKDILSIGYWDVPRLSNWHPKDRTNVRNCHLLDIHRTDLCYGGRGACNSVPCLQGMFTFQRPLNCWATISRKCVSPSSRCVDSGADSELSYSFFFYVITKC
jgi:hypothetical protein